VSEGSLLFAGMNSASVHAQVMVDPDVRNSYTINGILGLHAPNTLPPPPAIHAAGNNESMYPYPKHPHINSPGAMHAMQMYTHSNGTVCCGLYILFGC